ncbi:antitoxin YefM [Actinokineospora sp. NBRC 105648]|nr:antitoxin YefM [Actinokineospora sp. NBRC 105648]
MADTGQRALAPARQRTYIILYVEGRVLVKTMSYSESRAKYAETLDSVVNDREEVVITRAGHEPVVIVSLDDYQSLKETAYLLRSPENARRLITAIERLESGGGAQHDLAE